MLGKPDIGAHLRRLGKAHVFVGDLRHASGMAYLGATDAAVRAVLNTEYNDTTFEDTGPAVHESDVTGERPVLTIPLIIYDLEAQYAIISALASPAGGTVGHTPVEETGLLLIPMRGFPDAGITYNGSVWSPTDTDRSNWCIIPRGHFHVAGVQWASAEGSKHVEEVEFRGLFDMTEYTDDGHRSYILGDPVAAGFTAFRL